MPASSGWDAAARRRQRSTERQPAPGQFATASSGSSESSSG